jgi:hypothetical protein
MKEASGELRGVNTGQHGCGATPINIGVARVHTLRPKVEMHALHGVSTGR